MAQRANLLCRNIIIGAPMAHDVNEDSESSNRSGFLSGDELKEIVENGAVAVPDSNSTEDDDFETEAKSLGSDEGEGWSDWTIDLSLGDEVFLSSDDEIRSLDHEESIVIEPGEFALLITEEVVEIPNDKIGLISLKFSHARKGLINISGFHVDPNYRGRIVFSVYNASPSPVLLRRGKPVFMIVFANLTQAIEGNRSGASFQNIQGIETDWVESLQGRTKSLENLNERVGDLEATTELNRRLLIGIAFILITSIISFGAGVAIQLVFA